MTEQEMQELQTELTNKFEIHSNKFIGKSCNYVNGKLLEHSLNNILSTYVNTDKIESTSHARLSESLTDYTEEKKYVYNVSIVTLESTERVQINLVFEATV